MIKIKDILTSKVIIACLLILLTFLSKIYISKLKFIFLVISSFSFLLILTGIITKKYKISILNAIFFVIFLLFYIRIIDIQRKYTKTIKFFKNTGNVLGIINSYPIRKNNYLEVKVKIAAVKYKEKTDYTGVNQFIILLKIKEPEKLVLHQGDSIEINQKIKTPREKIFNFNYRDHLFNKKIYGVINTNEDKIKIINSKSVSPLYAKILKKTLWKFREIIIFKIKNKFSSEVSSFLLSIFLGLRNEIEEDVYNQFRNTGMVHLLAISGLHIGFIGMLFFKLSHLFLSKSKSLTISLIFLFLYILLIVPSASSARAFIMYSICAIYFVSGMKTVSINHLAISAIILMFINPYNIFDLGFQFSYLATAGIMLLAGPIGDKLPSFIHYKIKAIIAVTVSAFSSILCLQLSIFKEAAIFSLISSLAVVPLFGYYFAVCFVMLSLFTVTDIHLFTVLIEFSSKFFLKLINTLNFIPTLKINTIPRFSAYFVLPLLVIYFYIVHERFVCIIKNIKLKKVEKRLKINSKAIV